MYEWRYRLLFMMGKKLSGKYGLPSERPIDRHRWLFSLDDATSFIRFRATKNGFSIIQEVSGSIRVLLIQAAYSPIHHSIWQVIGT